MEFMAEVIWADFVLYNVYDVKVDSSDSIGQTFDFLVEWDQILQRLAVF